MRKNCDAGHTYARREPAASPPFEPPLEPSALVPPMFPPLAEPPAAAPSRLAGEDDPRPQATRTIHSAIAAAIAIGDFI
jgi:hypothetical protein